jgi:REP element-mobilizing transposase RayT
MARPLRIIYPGACDHFIARGNERRPIFESNRDREKFLDILAQVVDRYNLIVHSFCLMRKGKGSRSCDLYLGVVR